MASRRCTKFKGEPEDYLNWFNLGYQKYNEVKLPNETVSLFEFKKSEEELTHTKDDSSYAEVYVDDHYKEFQKNLRFGSKLSMFPHSIPKTQFEEVSTVTGSEFDENLDEHDLLKNLVYSRYDFSKKDEHSLKLPIADMKKEILQKIERYSVVVIQGHTGCGKSTQVPQFILDEGVEKHQHVNIFVTQPRKIAAISLASRVCDERGWRKSNSIVGYQVGLNMEVCEDTRLTFGTTEVLVQKAIHKKTLSEYTHIILDEIHERDEHTDFALLVVKKLLHTVSRNVKVILMSATIDCGKFANYFSTPVHGHLIPAPIIPITDKGKHNLQIYYLESLSKAFMRNKMPTYHPDKPGVSREMTEFAVSLIVRFDDIERQELGLGIQDFPKNRGAVLMFLPGIHEIMAVMELLDKNKFSKQWELFPLHSSLTIEEQRSAFRKLNPGFRKVIVSTNIAESSVTVPDIKYVIDFCLTKELHCDTLTNYTSLKMVWSSKASCTQRAGRAGRVSSGRIFRLIEEQFYDELRDHSTPELSRIPLSQVILKIKLLDLGEPKAMLALALDPPNLSSISRTILVLKQIGALNVKSGGNVSSLDGDLTYLGRIAASMPLDPKLSKLIVMGYLFGCFEECIVIAAGLSLKSFHSTPFQDEINAFFSKLSWAYNSFSDCIAIYYTYYIWQIYKRKGVFPPGSSIKEKEWARKSYIQIEALKDVEKLVTELKSRLKNVMTLDKHYSYEGLHEKKIQTFFIKICIAGAFYPSYFKQCIPEDYGKNIQRELSGNDPMSTLIVSGLPAHSNVLYIEQLHFIFRNCSSNLDISCEESRAYIEFPKRIIKENEPQNDEEREIPVDFPKSMLLALKMKQVKSFKDSLFLEIFSPEEEKERIAAIVTTGENKINFQNSRKVLKNVDKQLEEPSMPDPSVNVWPLEIVHVESPSKFWGVSFANDQKKQLGYISSLIEFATNDGLTPLLKKNLKSKKYCLAPYTDSSEGKEHFYRGRIEDIKIRDSTCKALVFFVDFGNTEVICAEALKELPDKLYGIPKQAVECSLCNVKPISLNKGQTVSEWTDDAIDWFRKNVIYKKFYGKIFSVVHRIPRLELLEAFPENENEPRASINSSLIVKGYAIDCEEGQLSMQNHQLRAIYSADIHSFRRKPNVLNNEGVPLSYQSSASTSGLSTSGYVGKRYLKGPYSPLEMKFVASTRNGSMKGVKIDSTSVNSLALDSEPNNPHEKFLISPVVALNQNETVLLLRSSTLMPGLPGVFGLCLIMFSPCVEMRQNEIQSGYSGALCGIGFDPQTDESLYPDDDIEVTFDFEFTNEDLSKVNSLRYLMSSCTEFFEMTSHDLRRFQEEMRTIILEIIHEKRKYVKQEMYSRAYKWNQVCRKDILHPEVDEDFEKDKNVVWTLHKGIAMKPDKNFSPLYNNAKQLKRTWKKLKEERRLDSHPVDEKCLLCNEVMDTFMNLNLHILSEEHRRQEQCLYGC